MTKTNKRLHTASMQLEQLSEEANKCIELIAKYEERGQKALQSALRYAKRCGKFLNAAQKKVPKGEWELWADGNIGLGESTRQNYMKIARRWPELKPALEKNPFLSINQARNILNKPTKPKESEQLRDARRKVINAIKDYLDDAATIFFAKNIEYVIEMIHNQAKVELPKRKQRHDKLKAALGKSLA